MEPKLYMLLLVAFATPPSTCYNRTLIPPVYNALGKTIEFVRHNSKNMNVDGEFGLTLGYAALINSHPQEFKNQLEDLQVLLLEVHGSILKLLPSEPYKYYVFNNYLLSPEIWAKPKTYRKLKLSPTPKVYTWVHDVNTQEGFTQYMVAATFDEELSDKCLVEMITASNATTPHNCPASDECKQFMFEEVTEYSPTYIAYGVTHRLLYLQIARARNCTMEEKWLADSIENYCSYIYWELKTNQRHGFIEDLEDLMLEQIVLCGGIEGFDEFFELDFLDHILKVQDECGGYPRGNRTKRESIIMEHGCNSHTTGLAVACLSDFFVHLLEEKDNDTNSVVVRMFNNDSEYVSQIKSENSSTQTSGVVGAPVLEQGSGTSTQWVGVWLVATVGVLQVYCLLSPVVG